MKFALRVVFAATLAGAGAWGQAGSSTNLPIPTITLIYPAPNGSIFDAGCADLLKTTVNPELVKQAVQRTPELQALWNKDAPLYLSTAFAEIGLPFPYKEMQATLTVCPGILSMSSPLFISVTKFLPSAAERSPDWLFVATLFHELIHTYVRPVQATSTLRKKYSGETTITQSHLTLMAVQKMVLLKLGKTEELKRIGEDYEASKNASYARAWKIVNEIEDYKAFVKELKDWAQTHRPA